MLSAAWSFHALPYWLLFGALLGAAAALAVCVSLRRRLDSLRRANLELNAIVHEQSKELVAANQRLTELALLDDLTGLSNRRHFDEIYLREWGRALREGKPLSVLMVDIDFFRIFNDHNGKEEGDLCLRRIGRVLMRSLRGPVDVAARYGAEEFAVMLPGTGIDAAKAVGERIRLSVAALWIPHDGSLCATHVTVSIGAASVAPAVGADPRSLLDQVERAVVVAKSKGRNCVATTDVVPATAT